MPALSPTLPKEERIYSKKTIDALFQGGHSRSMSAFPLRVVYMPLHATPQPEENNADATPAKAKAKMMVSVSKRCFKHAVDRNRVKRQVREAYRKHKALIAGKEIAMAFIWLDSRIRKSKEVEAAIVRLMQRIDERMQKDAQPL